MKEAVLVIVGFLGAGKTTFLRDNVNRFLNQGWSPYVILNDYLNANLDAQQFIEQLDPENVDAISGSCICCDGLTELRANINQIPRRVKGITLIEANGTTDACALMGFLGVGLKEHFLPPIQIAVVDVRHWQKRGIHNELEANQVQVSSLVVLNYGDQVDSHRREEVELEIKSLNPSATVASWGELDIPELLNLETSENSASKMDHEKSHWSACSVDLPDPMNKKVLEKAFQHMPESILRLKGCTRLGEDPHYSYIERLPSGEVNTRVFHGNLVAGPKLLAIGPGSHTGKILQIIQEASINP